MKRLAMIAAATVSVVALNLLAVAPTFAWENRLDGNPVSLAPGASEGVYFWHNSDGLHLATTDPHNIGHHYTGVLTTDGTFVNLDGSHLESDDSASISGTSELDFDFETFAGIDQINFEISGGSYVCLSATLAGTPLPAGKIYLGHSGQNPITDHPCIFR